MRRLAITALAACVSGALLAGTVVAAEVNTSVSLKNSAFGVYKGKVKADKPCAVNRSVEVWHDTNGNGQVDGDPPDFKIGETKSKRRGEYKIKGNQAPAGDNLIVVVKSKESGRDDCKGAVEEAKAQEQVE
jgi:hypothetical protein